MMICGNCGKTGIRWMGPFGNLTHTECPHCGGKNCQEVMDDFDEDLGQCTYCDEPATGILDGEAICDECISDECPICGRTDGHTHTM